MDRGPASLLVVIFDLEALVVGYKRRMKETSNISAGGREENDLLTHMIHALTIFVKAYSLMHRQNRLVILSYNHSDVHTVYPSPATLSSRKTGNQPEFLPDLPTLSSDITDRLINIVEEMNTTHTQGLHGKLSSALSNALTVINRQQILHPELQCRILSVQFDRDPPHNYNNIMNSIFSAQKMSVLIDALILSNFESLIMQQACYMTDGVYLKHGNWWDFLLILQSNFLADNQSRRFLRLPSQVIPKYYLCLQAF